jgi:hypothetical protein
MRSSVPPPLPPPAPSVTPPAIANKGVTSTFRAPPSAAPVAADAAPKRSGRGIVWLALACTLIGGLGYVIFHRPHTVTVAQASAELPAAAPVDPPSAPAAEPAPTPAPTPIATAEPSATASATPTPAPADSAAASADTAGAITVTVNSVPPKALFYHFGKEVGVAPFVVQLKPGERHAYEVGLPGHVTRKLVLDGTKTEITIGLNADPTTIIRRSPAF